MNLLLIHQFFLEKYDGGGSRFNEMTRVWAEKGHAITVLAGMVHYASGVKNERYHWKWTHRENVGNGIEVIRCYVYHGYNTSFTGRLWGYLSFVCSSVYAGIFKAKGKFDVILVTSPPLFVGWTAYVLSRLKGIPFVFEVRDLWPESAIDTGVLQNKWLIRMSFWLEKFLYRKAKRINVLTPAFREKLIRDKGVSPEKIFLIPNGADFTFSDHLLSTFDRDAFRAQLGFTGKKVILYVGAHGVANHLIQVLDTAAFIQKDMAEILFVLVGEGMVKEMLKENAKARSLDNVRFFDSVPKSEIFKYILASDFGLSVLKRVETFKTVYSNKTFDYMACKKPIFMLIDGVSRDLVEAASCGVYAEPENTKDFASKIRSYAAMTQAQLNEIGENGYRYAKAHFDRTRLAEEYLKFLT